MAQQDPTQDRQDQDRPERDADPVEARRNVVNHDRPPPQSDHAGRGLAPSTAESGPGRTVEPGGVGAGLGPEAPTGAGGIRGRTRPGDVINLGGRSSGYGPIDPAEAGTDGDAGKDAADRSPERR